jgi:inner membrane protein
MDTISQSALGASVGELILGRKLGYKAVVLGAVVANIPDLDVIFNPFLDDVTKLGWHRGYSHSLLFVLIASLLFGWLFHRLSKSSVSLRRWVYFNFWIFLTAILLDCFTVYGTQLFLPFSDYPVGFNSLAIVDPIVTIPLLIGVIWSLFLRRDSRFRRIPNSSALAIVTIYVVVITPAIKATVGGYFEQSLEGRDINYSRYMSAPTIFNAILWRMTAESDEGYWVGYYSLLRSTSLIVMSSSRSNRE